MPRSKKNPEETVSAEPSESLEAAPKPKAKKKTLKTCEAAPSHKKEHSGILQAEVNIGTAGHVDHGKTSLTKALTGKWTDTHSEELKRGISIRLGYADATFYEYEGLPAPQKYGALPEKDGKKGKILRKVSFVDAPGHETLMTTMLSGASLLDGALLVIAANEPCPQPRTAEHLMALHIAGVHHIVVAQNKVDLVTPERANESHNEIKKFLNDYGYASAPIVPVSANFNVNIDLLIQMLQEHVPTPKHERSVPLKMHISRSFDVNKPGTEISELKGGVLGGSITHGILSPGQTVEVTPGLSGKPFTLTVQSIQISEGLLSEAHAGGLIAIGTQLDPGITNMDKLKGQILCEPGSLPAPTESVLIEWNELPRLLGDKLPFPHVNELFVLTIGTNTVVGEIISIKKKMIDLQLKGKTVCEKGQKIAISRRDKAAWRLAGWGVVQ